MSKGVWRLRDTIEAAVGCRAVYWDGVFNRPAYDSVVGWGRKPTALRASRAAVAQHKPFIAIEDGWLRSFRPGPEHPPLSVLIDRIGVHYDATRPSELEGLIAARAQGMSAEDQRRASQAMECLRRHRLSKYNHAPVLDPTELGLDARPAAERVMVVDQTYLDNSVTYGYARAETFTEMLDAAIRENPGAQIIVKSHPEVVRRSKQGYLTSVKRPGVTVVTREVNPWVLVENVGKVYAVSSQLGFEALMAGCHVVCFGAPYYAGWGLTDDRVALPRRAARPTLQQLFTALYFDYPRYVQPDTLERIEFEQAVGWLLSQRDGEVAVAAG